MGKRKGKKIGEGEDVASGELQVIPVEYRRRRADLTPKDILSTPWLKLANVHFSR